MDNLLYSCFSFPNKPEHFTQKICIFSFAELHWADWPRTQRRQCWNSVPPLWARFLVSWNVSRDANSKTTDTEGETWLPEETVGHPANTKTAGPFAVSTVNKKGDQPDKLELASMNTPVKTLSVSHLLVSHHQPQVPLFGRNTRIATVTTGRIRLLGSINRKQQI